jgi:hypothetical protein
MQNEETFSGVIRGFPLSSFIILPSSFSFLSVSIRVHPWFN